MEFTIPQLLSYAAIRGYSPQLGSAINTLLSAENEIEYQEALKTATQEVTGYDVVNVSGTERDQLGGPAYMPLLFESTDSNDDLLLDSAIVEITRQKNIVVTNIQGRSGSVKEFINNGDYQIKISGLLCSHKAGYPMDKVMQLQNYLNAERTISIVHKLLNKLGVDEIVITDYQLPKSPFINGQPYSINAISDSPIELRLS